MLPELSGEGADELPLFVTSLDGKSSLLSAFAKASIALCNAFAILSTDSWDSFVSKIVLASSRTIWSVDQLSAV